MNANGCEPPIRISIRAVLCLSIMLVAGCGTFKSAEPEWVRNPKTAYPDKTYLVAVGEGDTRRAAENAADANLARIFESHIESDERVVDTVRESGKEFTRTTDLSTDINILSSQTLFNIQHAEAWKDRSGRYHAVAYLNRRDTAALYRDKVADHTDRVASLLRYAEQANGPLEKYALLRAAVRTALENDLLLRQLKVIHPATASASAPPYSLDELQKATTDTAKRILVRISIEGDSAGQMTACLQELVTSYGFVIGEPYTLGMTGSVSITDTGLRTAGLVFFRYNLNVRIHDDEDRVLTTINAKGREAVGSPDEAPARCYRTMESTALRMGALNMDTYFNSLVEHVE